MVGKIIEADTQLYNQDLFVNKKHSIFQSIEMFRVWKETKNFKPFFTILENPQGQIAASLLAVIQREHNGFLGKFSSRAIIIGKPVYEENNLEALDNLLKSYNKYVGKQVIYSQFRNLKKYTQPEKGIFESNGFCYEPHLDIIHSIQEPINQQFKALHKGRRKNIRRAERANVQFREVNSESEFMKAHCLVVSTYDRVKLPLPNESLFIESYGQLSAQNILKVFVAVLNEEIIGCRMVLCYGDCIYDWYAGSSVKHIDKYPNDFLPWKVMEWGSQNGYKYFDFGGAGKPHIAYGVREYKLKFGGTLVEFGRFEKVHNKLLMKVGKIGLKMYKFVKQ